MIGKIEGWARCRLDVGSNFEPTLIFIPKEEIFWFKT
jgi:hypothetical protein